MQENSILHWGSVPQELDGGAVVNYYLWNMAHYIEPTMKHFVVPKNPEEYDPTFMPYMNGLNIRNPIEIADLMYHYKIPLMEAFHIAENVEPVIDPIHDIGGKIILHQTVHWEDDLVFRCKRLKDLDCIVAPTRWAKDQIAFNGKVSQDKIAYIPHAVDIEKFYPHKTALRKQLGLENKTVILFTGRYSSFKGVQQLIPIIRPLTEKYDCAFIIRACSFGDGYPAKLHEVFKRISLRNKNVILFDQWMPYDFMSELTASSDILISPTGHEGFNVPLIEGMASGNFVITTDIPNHREILGDCGMYVSPSETVGIVNDNQQTGYKGTEVKVPSSQALYESLAYAISNPELRKVKAIEGVQRVHKEYALHNIADSWINLINKMSNYNMDLEMKKHLLKL
jgi:glycosyltransferase involved in cell wall biosynthesis